MNRKQLRRHLESRGYQLSRGKRHFVFKNSKGETIIMPNHNKIDKYTLKDILKKVG